MSGEMKKDELLAPGVNAVIADMVKEHDRIIDRIERLTAATQDRTREEFTKERASLLAKADDLERLVLRYRTWI
jgi:hypothetical protein